MTLNGLPIHMLAKKETHPSFSVLFILSCWSEFPSEIIFLQLEEQLFSISCHAGLEMFFHPFLLDIFTGYRILVPVFFFFWHFKDIIAIFSGVCYFSWESAFICIVSPLMTFFSLYWFLMVFSLYLVFSSFTVTNKNKPYLDKERLYS